MSIHAIKFNAFTPKQLTELSALLGLAQTQKGDIRLSELKSIIDESLPKQHQAIPMPDKKPKDKVQRFKDCLRCNKPARFHTCAGVYKCSTCGYIMEIER